MSARKRREAPRTFAVLVFKLRGEATSQIRLKIEAVDALKAARDLADFAGPCEYIALYPEDCHDLAWSWYGYDCTYYAAEGIACGRLGVRS